MYIAALFWCTILEYMVDNLGAVTRSVHPNNEQSDFLKFLYNISKDDEGHGSQHFTLISRVPCLLLVANMDTGMDTVVA